MRVQQRRSPRGIRLVGPVRVAALLVLVVVATTLTVAGTPSRLSGLGLAPPGVGDPAAGGDYFRGVRQLQNGGPQCMACHAVAGFGGLGGGNVGPDLTASYRTFGDAGIAAILAKPGTMTMKSIFSDNPLTPQEQADLLAFLQQSTSGAPVDPLGQLAGLAVAGAVILLALLPLIWRRRLRGVRRPLLRGQA